MQIRCWKWGASGVVVVLVSLAAVAAPARASKPRAESAPSVGPCTRAVIAVGEQVFNDSRLSRDGTVSCASCHQPQRAFCDGRRVARGIGGQSGTRNTLSLTNAALATAFPWDGRRGSLEQQVLDPFVNSREHGLPSLSTLLDRLAADPRYRIAFRDKSGSGSVSLSKVAEALACYVRSLSAGDSAFDRFMYKGDRQALTDGQRRGLALFTGRGRCASCHTVGAKEAPLADGQFHAVHLDATVLQRLPTMLPMLRGTSADALGELVLSNADVAAVGRFVTTLDPDDLGRFRTPGLRNVELTAPYMHDGSVPTLESAVSREIYYRNPPGSRPVALTPSEVEDVVAFLKSLTSSQYAATYTGPQREP